MNTIDSQNQVPEEIKITYDRLKKIAFDWQKKFPLYLVDGKLTSSIQQLSVHDYLASLHQYIPLLPILSDQLLLDRLNSHANNPKLPIAMPKGYRICLCLLPFNFNGNEFTEEEIKKGLHLQEMIVDQNNVAYSAVSPRGSGLFQSMPTDVQQLSFISDGVPENILAQYQNTFKLAQTFFNS